MLLWDLFALLIVWTVWVYCVCGFWCLVVVCLRWARAVFGCFSDVTVNSVVNYILCCVMITCGLGWCSVFVLWLFEVVVMV